MIKSKYVRDLIERVATTFAVAFVSVLVAAGPMDLTSLSVWETAATAGVAAVTSLLKGVLARFVGDWNNASLLRK